MNILVPVKQVPDTGMNLRLSKGEVDERSLKWVLSPYDEFALEEALKLKKQLKGHVFVITLGPARAKEVLLTALALGADEAFHLLVEKPLQDPLTTAQLLKEKISEISKFSLIFCGKLSTDFNNFSVPQMLAALLKIPFVTNVSKLLYQEAQFILTREAGKGKEEILRGKPPLLLSADKGLNTPSYPSLPGIMKARKKPLHTLALGIKEKEKIKLVALRSPPERQAPVMISGEPDEQVKELLKILKEREKLL